MVDPGGASGARDQSLVATEPCPTEQQRVGGRGHWCGQRKLLCVLETSDWSRAVHN